MITRIEAYTYRCFDGLDVALDHYHVLAGANGSGKTTLLDIPSVFADLLYGRDVNSAFLERSPNQSIVRAVQPSELVHRSLGSRFTLVMEAGLPEKVVRKLLKVLIQRADKYDKERNQPCMLRYEVQFEVLNDVEIHVAAEYLTLFPDGVLRPPHGEGVIGGRDFGRKPWFSVIRREEGAPSEITPECARPRGGVLRFQIDPRELALRGVPSDSEQFPAVTWFKSFLNGQTRPFQPDILKMRTASPPGAGKNLLPDGENLPWLVLDLQQNDPDGFEEWTEHMKIVLPGVETIHAVVREEDRHAYFRLRYQNGLELTSSSLSEGTLRILALTVLPHLRRPPGLIMIEEPENSIHPRAIEAVLRSFEAMHDTRVWLSTHSPVVLANTPLTRVLCMRLMEDGMVKVVRGNLHPQLKDWKGGIDIGTLFAAGVLG